jgi:hypothetical protein
MVLRWSNSVKLEISAGAAIQGFLPTPEVLSGKTIKEYMIWRS